MMRLFAVAVLASPLVLSSQQVSAHQAPLPKGVVVWPKGLPPAGITHKDDYGTHILSISHREKDGFVEVHAHKDDVLVVQSGEATLVVGGKGMGMHATAPGEQQGTSIEGGTSMHVAAGDVITIPVGVPHQFFVAAGKQVTYLVVKVLAH